jgi:hypothetical protein
MREIPPSQGSWLFKEYRYNAIPHPYGSCRDARPRFGRGLCAIVEQRFHVQWSFRIHVERSDDWRSLCVRLDVQRTYGFDVERSRIGFDVERSLVGFQVKRSIIGRDVKRPRIRLDVERPFDEFHVLPASLSVARSRPAGGLLKHARGCVI